MRGAIGRSQGHLHPDCPKDKIGRFRLDHDNAHWIGPYDRDHTPDDEVDFPEEKQKRAVGSPYPGMRKWSPVGIIQDGLHGGPPLYHISCMYELQPIGKGEGGFGCIVVSTLSWVTDRSHSARIGGQCFQLTSTPIPPLLAVRSATDWRVMSMVQGSHLSGAKIGPEKASPLGAGHVPWGKPPWTPDVDSDVTRVEGQPGDCVLFTERLVHTTVPWTGRGERRSLFVKYVPYGAQRSSFSFLTLVSCCSAVMK